MKRQNVVNSKAAVEAETVIAAHIRQAFPTFADKRVPRDFLAAEALKHLNAAPLTERLLIPLIDAYTLERGEKGGTLALGDALDKQLREADTRLSAVMGEWSGVNQTRGFTVLTDHKYSDYNAKFLLYVAFRVYAAALAAGKGKRR